MAKCTRKAAAPTPVSPAVNDDVAAGRQHVQANLAAMPPATRKRLQQQQLAIIGQPVGATIPWVPVVVGPIGPRPEAVLLREIRDAMTAQPKVSANSAGRPEGSKDPQRERRVKAAQRIQKKHPKWSIADVTKEFNRRYEKTYGKEFSRSAIRDYLSD